LPRSRNGDNTHRLIHRSMTSFEHMELIWNDYKRKESEDLAKSSENTADSFNLGQGPKES